MAQKPRVYGYWRWNRSQAHRLEREKYDLFHPRATVIRLIGSSDNQLGAGNTARKWPRMFPKKGIISKEMDPLPTIFFLKGHVNVSFPECTYSFMANHNDYNDYFMLFAAKSHCQETCWRCTNEQPRTSHCPSCPSWRFLASHPPMITSRVFQTQQGQTCHFFPQVPRGAKFTRFLTVFTLIFRALDFCWKVSSLQNWPRTM